MTTHDHHTELLEWGRRRQFVDLIQLDGFADATGDDMIEADEQGYAVMGTKVRGPRDAADLVPVRLTVTPGTAQQVVLDLLDRMRAWVADGALARIANPKLIDWKALLDVGPLPPEEVGNYATAYSSDLGEPALVGQNVVLYGEFCGASVAGLYAYRDIAGVFFARPSDAGPVGPGWRFQLVRVDWGGIVTTLDSWPAWAMVVGGRVERTDAGQKPTTGGFSEFHDGADSTTGPGPFIPRSLDSLRGGRNRP